MYDLRRKCLPLVLAGALVALPAQAGIRLGLGADWWLYRGGEFNVTLAVDTQLLRRLYIGGRFGAYFAMLPGEIGVPIDLLLRLNLGQVYFEGLVGPWVTFGGYYTSGFPFRAHAALGFGLQASAVTFGLELGYLDPGAIFGIRLAWRI